MRKKAISVIKQPKNVPLAEAYMHIETYIRLQKCNSQEEMNRIKS